MTQTFSVDLHKGLLQQHHAAQFIALAGKYMIPHQPDDSNTNMEYLADRLWLIGKQLPGGLRIALILSELKLYIVDREKKIQSEIPLEGLNKQTVFEQLEGLLAESDLDVSTLKNELDFTLPDQKMDGDAVFSVSDRESTNEIINYRHNAGFMISDLASTFDKAEPVRIWPHHFDTGTFVPLRYNTNGGISRSIGLGWAIPDDLVREPYYYLSYWSEDPVENFNTLPKLEAGEWIRSGWHGAVARNTDIISTSTASGQYAYVETFFNSGIRLLREHYNL